MAWTGVGTVDVEKSGHVRVLWQAHDGWGILNIDSYYGTRLLELMSSKRKYGNTVNLNSNKFSSRVNWILPSVSSLNLRPEGPDCRVFILDFQHLAEF